MFSQGQNEETVMALQGMHSIIHIYPHLIPQPWPWPAYRCSYIGRVLIPRESSLSVGSQLEHFILLVGWYLEVPETRIFIANLWIPVLLWGANSIPPWWFQSVWLRIPIRVFSMRSCWRSAINHDTSEPSTLNMCNAIVKIYQQLQYLSNPSHPIASPWKPYQARPISELQAMPKWTVHHFFCSTYPHQNGPKSSDIQKHRTSTAARPAMYMMGWQYTKHQKNAGNP